MTSKMVVVVMMKMMMESTTMMMTTTKMMMIMVMIMMMMINEKENNAYDAKKRIFKFRQMNIFNQFRLKLRQRIWSSLFPECASPASKKMCKKCSKKTQF